MISRQPIGLFPPATSTGRRVPRCWLMADARLGDGLLAAIRRLPPQSGVVLRPYAMSVAQCAQMRALTHTARARRHLLLVAGRAPLGAADGRHRGGPVRRSARELGHLSMPVHNAREARAARSARASLAFISPVHATRSHPGAQTLGAAGFARLAQQAGVPAIALGGMDARRFAALRRHGASGWAAIDAWSTPG